MDGHGELAGEGREGEEGGGEQGRALSMEEEGGWGRHGEGGLDPGCLSYCVLLVRGAAAWLFQLLCAADWWCCCVRKKERGKRREKRKGRKRGKENGEKWKKFQT
jgi:hypothetical protein